MSNLMELTRIVLYLEWRGRDFLKLTFLFLGLLLTIMGCASKGPPPPSQKWEQSYKELLKKYQELDQKYQALTEAPPQAPGPETAMDVRPPPSPPPPSVHIQDQAIDGEEIDQQIEILRQSRAYIESQQFDLAFQNLKKIEASRYRQIQVRARFLTGEILYAQKEFDLAMQVFEEILTKDAFSGIVLESLRRLVVCAQELGLKEKQNRYHSLLYDFFES